MRGELSPMDASEQLTDHEVSELVASLGPSKWEAVGRPGEPYTRLIYPAACSSLHIPDPRHETPLHKALPFPRLIPF